MSLSTTAESGDTIALLRLIRDELQLLRVTLSKPHGVAAAVPSPLPDATPRSESVLLDWLAARGLRLRKCAQPNGDDPSLDRVALFLGDHFETLAPLHDKIRQHLSDGSPFSVRLHGRTQDEVTTLCRFGGMLNEYALLSSYYFNSAAGIIHAVPQRLPKVTNFFTGGWFERFIQSRVGALVDGDDAPGRSLRNVELTFPNGETCELDLLFLADGQPLWVECKTGDYQAHIARYMALRSALQLPRDRALLVVLGLSDAVASHLSGLYELTFANHRTVVDRVRESLSATPTQAIA